MLNTAVLINTHILRDVLSSPLLTYQKTIAQRLLKLEQCFAQSNYSMKSRVAEGTWPSRRSWAETGWRGTCRPGLTPESMPVAASVLANTGR